MLRNFKGSVGILLNIQMYTAQDVLLYHWISLLDTQQAALAWKREESGWAVAITSGLLITQNLRKHE